MIENRFENRPRIIVIGGGLSGLSLAYRLQEKLPQASLTLLEKAERAGGKIDTFQREGFTVECGPNGFLDAKESTLKLCFDLGLKEQLQPASEESRKFRYLNVDGELFALPNSLFSFICSPLLSWRGKVNLLCERFRRPLDPPLADESIDAFANRRVGREIAEKMADAIVTGIHAGDPELLSLPAAFPRIAAFEREHGSVWYGMRAARMERKRLHPDKPPQQMWSFRGGLKVLIDAMRDRLGERVRLGSEVLRLERVEKGWVVHLVHGEAIGADVVVDASPSYAQAEHVESIDREMAEEMRQIAYTAIAVVALGFRKNEVQKNTLSGFGFITPQRTRRDVLGVQWCSSIYPGRAPEDAVLWRGLCGGWNRPDVLEWDDDRLIDSLCEELRLTQGVEAKPIFSRVIRWQKAIPQYHLGHLARVARIDRLLVAHPGLFVAGNSYRGVAMNDCTEQAERLTADIADYCN
jgi:oxygen-dependent protoporphyrinogen oxidase